jgi:hypothetical protein
VYDRLQKISNEIQNYSGAFLGAKVISVQQTGENIPSGTTRLSKLPASVKLLETVGEGAVVSLLENKGKSFLVLVNRDFKNELKLVIYTDEKVKKVMKDGTLINAAEFAAVTEIEPGDAAIYLLNEN